ncbi:hypothetical protein BD779DRAFT_1790195 [Infundibulicybe gibba]|nr:hypothetical protein BD779DRAFT_1790195 [Infundibulicybe gibba]
MKSYPISTNTSVKILLIKAMEAQVADEEFGYNISDGEEVMDNNYFDGTGPDIQEPEMPFLETPVALLAPQKTHKKQKKADRNKETRALKRKADQLESGHNIKRIATKKLQAAQSHSVTEVSIENLPITKPGWKGIVSQPLDHPNSLEQLQVAGFQEISWDGDITRVILDADGRLLVVLFPGPCGPGWKEVTTRMASKINNLRTACTINNKHLHHRRGDFAALDWAVSFGGGQQANSDVSRVSQCMSKAFMMYYPAMEKYYRETLHQVCAKYPDAKPPPGGLFAGKTINMGPKAICKPHVDSANLGAGICPVFATGNFDHRNGGHLVLQELKLAIQFPPGCYIFFPSALITHWNLPIQQDETRYSLTWYTAAGLFRWCHNDGKTDKKALTVAKDKKVYIEQKKEENQGRFSTMVARFPIWSEHPLRVLSTDSTP